jgi:FtsZ-binding cell division protein ZapB
MNSETAVEEAVQVGVDRLESEIERAVGLIDRLRQENRELRQKAQRSEEQAGRHEQDLNDARAERDRLQKVYEENASLIERKGEIQRKIETMLSRLDGVTADA